MLVYKDMKKIFSILFLIVSCYLLCYNYFINEKQSVFAQDNCNLTVITNSCNIYEEPSKESKILKQVYFGDTLIMLDENFYVSGVLKFYKITYDGISGYVIANAVVYDIHTLKKELDPNAKILKEDVNVYSANNDIEENKIKINGVEVLLKQYQEVKIIDGYDKKKEFTKIMFEYDGQILTGYIETNKLLVEGFNKNIILAIFIFILTASIIVSIILTTRKKRKKIKKTL